MVFTNFKKINGSQDVLTFGDFTVPKIVLQNKIIDKTQRTRNQENSTLFWRSLSAKSSCKTSTRQD